MQSNEISRSTLKYLAAIFFALIIAFHIGCALAGKPIIRGNHLGTALEYAHGSINLLRPVIVGFTANGSPTALEFPIWQATTAFAFKAVGSTWYGWANVVSLLYFATMLWPFFQLARQYLSERAAWWSLIFLLTQPLIILYAGWGCADGFSLVVMVWFLFCADRLIRSRKIASWIPTAFFAALSAVSKMPFFMAAGLFSVFLLLLNGIRAWRPWVLLATAGLFAAVIFAAWTRHTNALAAEAEFPYQELRLSQSPWIKFWYFGDLHYRFSPEIWAAAGWRFIHGILGALPMVALMLIPLIRPGSRFAKLWLLGVVLTTLVFTQIVLRHWHYFLMCCPAIAMLCGSTIERWEPFLAQEIPWKSVRLGLISIVLMFAAVDGIVSMRLSILVDPYLANMGKVIRDHTQPGDRIVLFDRGFFAWGGDALFRADRNGLEVFALHTDTKNDPNVIGLVELLDNESHLRRLKSLGYSKLVLLSESPVECAAQTLAPGGINRRRFTYPSSISPTVDAWPVIYQTDDIEIKEIP